MIQNTYLHGKIYKFYQDIINSKSISILSQQ